MGNWLKIYRIKLNLSQAKVASMARITTQHYNYIENGSRRPSPQVAKRIAEALGFKDEWYRLLEAVVDSA